MACSMCVAVAFMFATAVVQANECSSGSECPGGDEPTSVASLLQTKVQTKVLTHGGEEAAASEVPHATKTLGKKTIQPGNLMEKPSALFGEPSSNNSATLQAWFEEHGLSKQVEMMRSPNADDGDGSVGNVQWPYFANKCMQRRQVAVAREMLKRGCEHVVEVGGYLTPLDAFLRDLASNSSYKLPKTYINIDPSVNMAIDVTDDGMRSVHFPMSLADFTATSAKPFRTAFNLMELARPTENVCAVMLGVWDPHVATKHDRRALYRLLRHVEFLACSAPSDEMEHLSVVEHIAKRAHDLQPTVNETVFDCSKELHSEKSHWPGDEVEHMDYLSESLLETGAATSKLLTMSWHGE